MERLVQSQEEQIQYLRNQIEEMKQPNILPVLDEGPKKEYKAVGKGREPWSVIQGRIAKEELRKARENANTTEQSGD